MADIDPICQRNGCYTFEPGPHREECMKKCRLKHPPPMPPTLTLPEMCSAFVGASKMDNYEHCDDTPWGTCISPPSECSTCRDGSNATYEDDVSGVPAREW